MPQHFLYSSLSGPTTLLSANPGSVNHCQLGNAFSLEIAFKSPNQGHKRVVTILVLDFPDGDLNPF
jgi:hypothetical protein